MPMPSNGKTPWTEVFADEILEIAKSDSRVVGITGAMMIPVGFG